MEMPRRRSAGFSLIELLIVVAIIAALVGVAVPFFQNNIDEANRAKAAQDLDLIAGALSRFQTDQGKPLLGTSLKPLLGRYLQSIPVDPWGNEYLYDGAAAVLLSYGADTLPLGTGGDHDLVRRLASGVRVERVQYQGSWGRPRPEIQNGTGAVVYGEPLKGNAFVISTSRPVSELNFDMTSAFFVLLRNVDAVDGAPTPLYDPAPPGPPPAAPWEADLWRSVAKGPPLTKPDTRHRPDQGTLVIRAFLDSFAYSTSQAITPTMALDFREDVATGSAAGTLETTYYPSSTPPSPMDLAIYGPEALATYQARLEPAPRVDQRRPGVRLEKY